mgnify:FL=1|tara:strand:+ start:18 stop:764 length:747 start_codon:yes stop_codon:yes gene_type:complete
MPFSFLAKRMPGDAAGARRFNASSGDLSGCAQDYEEAVKAAHDVEPHYLEPWIEQPASRSLPPKPRATDPVAIPKATEPLPARGGAQLGLKRCQASAGDLSGAAEDVQEALGSWSDVPEDHSPTTVLGGAGKKGPQKKAAARRKANVWESVFNPGRNYNMEGRVGASQFDNPDSPGGRSTTVWDEILKAETVRSFSDLDQDGDGFITASELRKALGQDASVSSLIEEADRNGDGKIDYQEFRDLLRHS